MPYLAGFVTPQDFGALGNGVNDDSSAINSALAFQWNTNGGGYVLLPPGNYAVANPVIIPPYTFLVGQVDITLNLLTIPTTVAVITALASWAPGSSTGIVEILSKTPGGWSQNTAACGVKNVYINGANNTSTNLNGINIVGPCYDVHLEDVFINTPGHNGITASGQTESGITPTYPYHQRYDRVTCAYATLTGFNLTNFTDSTYVNCMAFQAVATGWSINNCSNSVWTSCRAEWNEYGFGISGSSGSLVFTGCTTDQNSREGLYINTATSPTSQGGGIVWTGGKMHADANGAVSGHTNGILVTSSTVPVTITGVNIETGINSAVYYPANAITLTSSSNIVVADSVLQGFTSAWNDTGGNTKLTRSGCIGMTGTPGSQTITILPNLDSGGITVGATAPLGDNGVGTLQLANAGTVPTTNPTGGATLYATGGNVGFRSSAGFAYDLSNNVTTSTTTPTTLTTTASFVALATGSTVAANTLAAGQVYKVRAWGVFTCTTAQSIQLDLFWGGVSGTSLLTWGQYTPTSNQTAAAWGINIEFVANSSTSISAVGEEYMAYFLSSMTQQTTTVTSTGSNQLVLGVDAGGGTTGASITCNGFYFERVR